MFHFLHILLVFALLRHGESARGTDLIHRKTTTTTTTTEAPIALGDGEESNDPSLDEDGKKINLNLTGIPQIDYVYDPNLPRELNGYNLSTYPFLEFVPDEEDIGFTCDGLHDGFYASVKWNCQLYHHCVYAIRNDFLCPNFTSFDQKTFICHFASEVDCKNSPRYFYRNDALYKKTTSQAPPTTSTTSTTTTTTTTEAPKQKFNENGNGKQRPYGRPYRRRPPVVDDYYDDYYYDDIEQPPQRFRRPVVRDDFNDYDNPRRYRLRKVHGSRRNVYHVDRRPVPEYDDEEEVAPVEQRPQANQNFKPRRVQPQTAIERPNDQKLETTDRPFERPERPFSAGSNSKFYNKYLPKLNKQTYNAPSTATPEVKESKKLDKKPARPSAAEEEYEYAYEDGEDYVEYPRESLSSRTKQYNTKPLPITDKPLINGREKGLRRNYNNRQN